MPRINREQNAIGLVEVYGWQGWKKPRFFWNFLNRFLGFFRF